MMKIENCPFCGSKASLKTVTYNKESDIVKLNKQFVFYGVNCQMCGGENTGIIGYKTQDDAINAWNKRVKANNQ